MCATSIKKWAITKKWAAALPTRHAAGAAEAGGFIKRRAGLEISVSDLFREELMEWIAELETENPAAGCLHSAHCAFAFPQASPRTCNTHIGLSNALSA
jgi:hypothetical protein